MRSNEQSAEVKKRCAVWGTNSVGQQAASMARETGYEVAAFCRSTYSEEKSRLGDLPIVTPSELKRLYDKNEINWIIIGIRNPVYVKEVDETLHNLFTGDAPIISLDEIENEYLRRIHGELQYRWEIDFQNYAKNWLQNFMSEVKFWAEYVAEDSGIYHQNYLRCLENREFNGIFTTCGEIMETLKADSVVMDIGCGLVSKYGNVLPDGQEVKLLPVDPLAPFYNRINEQYSQGKYHAVQFGLFEFIADFYERNYCDLVLINNALDHCIDPYKSLIECLYIVKKNGKIRLSHRRAEALYEAYNGLHKWNMDFNEENQFIIWNTENAINVSTELREICDIQVVGSEENCPRAEQWMTAYITKTNDFPLEQFIDLERERYDLAFFVKQLMEKLAEQPADYLQ